MESQKFVSFPNYQKGELWIKKTQLSQSHHHPVLRRVYFSPRTFFPRSKKIKSDFIVFLKFSLLKRSSARRRLFSEASNRFLSFLSSMCCRTTFCRSRRAKAASFFNKRPHRRRSLIKAASLSSWSTWAFLRLSRNLLGLCSFLSCMAIRCRSHLLHWPSGPGSRLACPPRGWCFPLSCLAMRCFSHVLWCFSRNLILASASYNPPSLSRKLLLSAPATLQASTIARWYFSQASSKCKGLYQKWMPGSRLLLNHSGKHLNQNFWQAQKTRKKPGKKQPWKESASKYYLQAMTF